MDNMQQLVISLVLAAMQGDEKANAQILQIIESAKKGNKEALVIANMILEVITKLQPKAAKEISSVKAKFGTKLNYLRTLKGTCAPDEELVYFKQGGRMGCACLKKVQTAEKGDEILDPVQKFKKGRKAKKKC